MTLEALEGPTEATLELRLTLGSGVTTGALRCFVRLLDELQVDDEVDLYTPALPGHPVSLGVELDALTPVPANVPDTSLASGTAR